MESNLNKSVLSSVSSNLSNITKDVAEAAFDSLFDDGFIKDVPVLGTIGSMLKIGAGIRERIFVSKLLKFLVEIKDIPKEEREEFVNKLQENEYRNKAGEKIIIILDKLDDSDKSSMVGKLFKACVEGKFGFNKFLRLSYIINNALIDDIKALKASFVPGTYTYHLGKDVADSLYRLGLASSNIIPDSNSIYRRERMRDNKTPLEYEVEYKLNDDALIISRELFDMKWIEKAYHVYDS